MNIYLALAAGLAVLITLTHLILGGKEVARPLLDADLRGVPKYTSYYCWHIVTLELAGIAVMFALAAFYPTLSLLGWVAGAFSLTFVVFGIVMNAAMKRKFAHHPQWSFFVPLAALSVVGGI
ncbi:hypothetical protein [Woodsholea maritima]|uniref:hypothetical protein n=1 Tax=Woodsholea maritima TaxID=240237 RepID=UPI000363FCC2|nr:hypothetical protein [Woodsholea maritima]